MEWFIVIITLLLTLFKSSNKPFQDYQKVAVIIPAFNEEKNVANVIKTINELDYVDEIIVVNDGSIDNTAIEAKNAGAVVLNHEENRGKGEAINTGYNYTDADIIAFIDADIHNLNKNKVNSIIMPILEGKTEITKTKFARESGRVTELTAKPLLNFFFPEISFEQPLSGQFAAKKSALKKINFEPDYGVDVGIVLDADVQGISIEEVDIGEIKHDMSPLQDLNIMANEVVRTIINRANKYGRVIMIDDIGYFIRMSIVGLSLIILGLFTIFFVKFIPLELGVIVTFAGIAIAFYYLFKVIVKSIAMFKKTPRGNLIKSFIKIHFPVLLSAIILILMISTFIGATTFDNGTISIEPNSRNLIIFSDQPDNAITVRGPYTVDTAIENESTILRMPLDAIGTLGFNYGDSVVIKDHLYSINETREDEGDIIRLPIEVKEYFDLKDGEVLQNSRLNQVFDGVLVNHNIEGYNITENYIMNITNDNVKTVSIFLDNESVANLSGSFSSNGTYNIMVNGKNIAISCQNNTIDNDTIIESIGNHTVKITFENETGTSIKQFVNASKGSFLDFKI